MQKPSRHNAVLLAGWADRSPTDNRNKMQAQRTILNLAIAVSFLVTFGTCSEELLGSYKIERKRKLLRSHHKEPSTWPERDCPEKRDTVWKFPMDHCLKSFVFGAF
jgi:hypothetical protein